MRLKRHRSRKSCKYTYQLFVLVDEGSLDELAQRNGMNGNYLHKSCQENKTIYGKYRCAKRLKGENYGKKKIKY